MIKEQSLLYKLKIDFLFLILILLNSSILNAQVGVNTNLPEATLDIKAKNSNSSTDTNIEGVLIPRITRLRAQNMQSVKESTLVYINDISDGSAIDKAEFINEIGFYYFNEYNNKWIKLRSSSTSTLANSGVKKLNDVIKLGGDLLEPTTIGTSGINTLNITGLEYATGSNDVLLIDKTNYSIKKISIDTFLKDSGVPINVFNAQQITDISTILNGNQTINRAIFSTTNIIPPSEIGSWSNNVFTVKKSGVYQISSGIMLNDITNNAALSITAGAFVQSVGGLKVDNNKYTMNGILVVKLNVGDNIYVATNSGQTTTYTQSKGFINIYYSSK